MSKEKKSDLLLLLVMSLIISLLAFYKNFTSENPKTFNERLIFDSYYYAGNGYKTKSNFYIKSEDKEYTIPSTIFSVFNYSRFKEDISKGDTLYLVIDESKIVFQISSKNKTYLESKDSIKVFENNDFIGLIIGVVFCMFSIFLFGKILYG